MIYKHPDYYAPYIQRGKKGSRFILYHAPFLRGSGEEKYRIGNTSGSGFSYQYVIHEDLYERIHSSTSGGGGYGGNLYPSHIALEV